MPKTKRKRYATPKKKPNSKPDTPTPNQPHLERDVRVARGRLMGALLGALEADESDSSVEKTPKKRGPKVKNSKAGSEAGDEVSKSAYVLKLFDRSVDLSQFTEDTPLYPICRAWIINQPRANYTELGKDKYPEIERTEESVDLPGPEGPPVSRIPELLPEQKTASKDDINLDYEEAPPVSLRDLINSHVDRWTAVKRAWLNQAAKVEARYSGTHRKLREISRLH